MRKHRLQSIQFKLYSLFIISILLPLLLLLYVLPRYVYRYNEAVSARLTGSVLSAMANNLELYLSDLERVTLAPYLSNDIIAALRNKRVVDQDRLTPYDVYMTNKTMTDEAPMYLQLLRDDVTDVLLLPLDGSAYLVSDYDMGVNADYDFISQSWYQRAVSEQGRPVYIGLHAQDYLHSRKKTNVFSVARAIKDPQNGAILGVVVADTDARLLAKIAGSIDLSGDSVTIILDADGRPLYASREAANALPEALSGGARTVMLQGQAYEVVSRDLEQAGWKLCVLLSGAELSRGNRVIHTAGVITGVVWVLLMIVLLLQVTHSIIRPIGQMREVMHRAGSGDLSARFHSKSHDEVAELGYQLNSMIGKTGELIQREHEAMETERRLVYESLQAQIRPHFLYNTMSGLLGLNRMGMRDTLEQMILALADITRYIYSQDGFVPLQREIEILKKYCELQKLRFGDRLEYAIEADEAYLNALVPKLLLQPLVENSVIHGIEPMDEGGMLRVSAARGELDGAAALVMEVCDNGMGFDPETLDQSRVGIRSVIKRLAFVYPAARFEINASPGGGCRTRISIPEEAIRYEVYHRG